MPTRIVGSHPGDETPVTQLPLSEDSALTLAAHELRDLASHLLPCSEVRAGFLRIAAIFEKTDEPSRETPLHVVKGSED